MVNMLYVHYRTGMYGIGQCSTTKQCEKLNHTSDQLLILTVVLGDIDCSPLRIIK